MLVPFIALGCSTEPVESGAPGPDFSVFAAEVEGGALLSAWSDGDTLLMVGGQIGGGPGILARLDDGVLCVESDIAEKTPWWIHGEGKDWVAVGESGLALFSRDGTRTRSDVPTESTLYGAWMSGGEVLAVGGKTTAEGGVGEAWRYREGVWTQVASNLPGALYKVWDGLVVGDSQAYRDDGTTLVPLDFPGGHVLTVRGRAADDVYAVGGFGAPEAWHYDGAAWSAVDATVLGQPLNGVWTAPGESVWVAGNFGVVARLEGEAWIIPEIPLTADHLHAAWKHGEDVYFVGGNLFSGGEKYGTILRYGEGEATAAACGGTASLPAAGGWLAALAPAAHAANTRFPVTQLAGPTGTVTLGGKPVVVNLWASWCAPCLEELPLFDQLATRLGDAAQVVAVSVDTAWGPASGVVARLGLKLSLAHDPAGKLPRALAAPGLPATYIVDGRGEIKSTLARAITADELDGLEAQVRALVAP